jgi:interferon-induced GTP-binding protein Mx1
MYSCPLRLIMKRAKNGEEWSARVSTSENPHKPISVPSPATLTATIERLTTSLTRNSVGFSTESIIVELVRKM